MPTPALDPIFGTEQASLLAPSETFPEREGRHDVVDPLVDAYGRGDIPTSLALTFSRPAGQIICPGDPGGSADALHPV